MVAHYAHLRKVIVRAQEDVERWAENKPPLMMSGIKDQNAYDFGIYENAYAKFLKKKQAGALRNLKPQLPVGDNPQPMTSVEVSLKRIADALERIANVLEKRES